MKSIFSVDQIIEANRANAEFAQRAQHIALKGAADLVNRQTAAMKETYDQLSALYRDAGWTADAAEVTKRQQDYAQTAMTRAVEHFRLAFDLASETNKANYELMQEAMARLSNGNSADAADVGKKEK